MSDNPAQPRAYFRQWIREEVQKLREKGWTLACDVVDVINPHGRQRIAWRLERIEGVMSGMSRRSRLLLLNALLKGELNATRMAKAGRQT